MNGEHLRTEPVADDDDAVERALAGANVLALVASVVHLTGDPSILRGPIRPRRFVFNEFAGGLTEDEQATLRQEALAAVCAYRDAGSLIQELWGEGQRWPAEEFLKDITGSTLEMEAVADRVREHLALV